MLQVSQFILAGFDENFLGQIQIQSEIRQKVTKSGNHNVLWFICENVFLDVSDVRRQEEILEAEFLRDDAVQDLQPFKMLLTTVKDTCWPVEPSSADRNTGCNNANQIWKNVNDTSVSDDLLLDQISTALEGLIKQQKQSGENMGVISIRDILSGNDIAYGSESWTDFRIDLNHPLI